MTLTQGSAPSSSNRRSRRAGSAVPEPLLPIGDVAREFGVTLRTLRFYEDKGLLSPHRDGTSRLYRDSDRAKIALILKGKKLGFTLGEIRESLAAAAGGQDRMKLSLKPEQILSQIAHLTRQRSDIESAIAQLRAAHERIVASDIV